MSGLESTTHSQHVAYTKKLKQEQIEANNRRRLLRSEISKTQKDLQAPHSFDMKPKVYPEVDPKLYGGLYVEFLNKKDILFMKNLKDSGQNIKISKQHKKQLEIDDDIRDAILQDTTSF